MNPKGKPQGINHAIVEAFINTEKLHRAVLERRLNKNGMFRAQHQILMCISWNQDMSQKELAEQYHVSAASIAVSLKKLEKGGYIRRLVDRDDNRYNKIRLTEKGKEEVERSISFFEKTEEGMLSGFSEEEKKILYQYIRRLTENLEQMLPRTE